MNPKIGIVMPYFNRQEQLNRTLKSIENSSYKNIEIILVDDASDIPVVLPKSIFYKYPIHLITTPKAWKFWTSCAVIPYNSGISKALDLGSDIIVLQNPENFHVGDVLSHVASNTSEGVYSTYACFSLSKGQVDEKLAIANQFGACSSGDLGWYNHSIHRPCYMEFFAAITRKDMISLNGYDERFADGVACGDCDLFRRVKNLGLRPEIIDNPFVIHQWHYSGSNPYDDNIRFKRNQDLFYHLEKYDSGYRAQHIFTKDFDGTLDGYRQLH